MEKRLADVVTTFKIMPESPEINLDNLQKDVHNAIVNMNARIYKTERQPIAFGLVALIFAVVMPEGEGGTEPIEAAIKKVKHVADVQVTDVTRLVDVSGL